MDGIGDGSIDVQALEVALSSSGQELMVVGGDMDNLNKLLGLQFNDDAVKSIEEKECLLSDIDVHIQEDSMIEQSDDAVKSTQENDCLSDKIVHIQEDTISDGEISDEIPLGTNEKKRKPRKNGQYIRSPGVVSPENQLVREKNRKKSALSRKKINLFKQLKSLHLATGYTGVLILKEDDKGIIYGGTDAEMAEKFEKGVPLLHSQEMEEKSSKNCKKIDMSKIMDRIASSGREVSGLVPESPLPSPSKLSNCLSDLADSQQIELINLNLNMDDSTSLVSPPVIKKKKPTAHVTVERQRGGKRGSGRGRGRGRGKENKV